MAEASELPRDLLASLPGRADVVQPTSPLSRLPRVSVVLPTGRSERLESVTGGGSKALFRLGGLSLVERVVRSLLARGLERILVVVGHDAGPVAAVVGRLGCGRVRAVYADRWADGNGAALAAVQGEVQGEALFDRVEWTAEGWVTTDLVAGLRGGATPTAPAALPAAGRVWLTHFRCGGTVDGSLATALPEPDVQILRPSSLA